MLVKKKKEMFLVVFCGKGEINENKDLIHKNLKHRMIKQQNEIKRW